MNTTTGGKYPECVEQELLGIMLCNREACQLGLFLLGPGDFCDKAHEIIFSALGEAHVRAMPPDPFAMAREMQAHGIGWNGEDVNVYLEHMKFIAPSADGDADPEEIVRELIRKRREQGPAPNPQPRTRRRQAPAQIPPFAQAKLHLVEDPRPHDGALQFCDWKDLLPHYGDIEWVWRNWLPRGMVSILAAETGIGKTACAMGLAGILTGPGEEWPDGLPGPEQPERVVFIETENRTHLLLQRLEGWGLGGFELVRQLPRDDRGGIDIAARAQQEAIANAVKRTGARLLIIDSLSAGHRLDENSKQMKRLLLDLCRLAQETNVALLAIHHLRKRRGNESTMTNLDRLRGSSTIAQLAVVTLTLERPDPGSRTLALRQIKNNVAAEQPPVGMQITQDGVVWTDAPEGVEDKGSALERARDFVLEALRDGPCRSTELASLAQAEGVSLATLYRAMKSIALERPERGVVALRANPTDIDPNSVEK